MKLWLAELHAAATVDDGGNGNALSGGRGPAKLNRSKSKKEGRKGSASNASGEKDEVMLRYPDLTYPS